MHYICVLVDHDEENTWQADHKVANLLLYWKYERAIDADKTNKTKLKKKDEQQKEHITCKTIKQAISSKKQTKNTIKQATTAGTTKWEQKVEVTFTVKLARYNTLPIKITYTTNSSKHYTN